MPESPYRKVALPLVLISLIMVGISGLKWYQGKNQVQTLTLATASPTGEYHAFGQALAKVVERHNPKIRIQVISSEGSEQNEEWLQQHKVELAIVQNDTYLSPSTHTVSLLFPEVFHIIARKSANIQDVQDLKGKKIALLPKGSGSYSLFWLLSRHYGLEESDLKVSPLSLDQGIQSLITGDSQVFFRVIALGNAKMTKLLQNPELELVPIDQGAALQLFLPALEQTQIPKGTYNGAIPIPSENLNTVGVRSVLVAHHTVNSQVIHEITRILHEARNDLIRENVQAAMIPPPNSLNHLGFTLHSGAKAYYNQDKPSFIVAYAEPISLGISVGVLIISGVWQLRMWLQSKQKNRADHYNLELVQLIYRIQEVESLEELSQIREQLIRIFDKVIADLDKDKISQESFQSFAFPWDVALNTIHHREILLSNQHSMR